MKRQLVNKIKNRIRRYLNQRHRYDYSPENNGWKKYGNSPFFGDKKQERSMIPMLYLLMENLVYMLLLESMEQ